MWMRLMVLAACLVSSLCYAQSSSESASPASSSSKWQVAHVMAAKVHQSNDNKEADVVRYDVTVRVADTEYVLLYTPPKGIDVVEYKLGRDGLVLVGADTMKWNDILGRPHEAPILLRRAIPPKNRQ